jgi:hypothetical protein
MVILAASVLGIYLFYYLKLNPDTIMPTAASVLGGYTLVTALAWWRAVI